ncbi:MAG: diaminopimelate epimerase [Candidatus Hatepunaea meridiana]|nr:diaminopimelate epimerase [Candidatus Hatepunaea meridiana]
MKTNIPFEKYQGLGNDFILFDQYHHPDIPTPSPETISQICNRRFGIGADGILLFSLDKTEHPEKQVRMVYYNSDGSRAETCFNGIRCIALHSVLTDVTKPDVPFDIITDAAVIKATVTLNPNLIQMELMQSPEFEVIEGSFIFNKTDDDDVDSPLPFRNYEMTGTKLILGNPHFVVWSDTDDLNGLNGDVIGLGKLVETAPFFPNGTNFEMARVVGKNKILMAVWERGSGRTLACGSGAAATVCAGVASGKLKAGLPVEVTMLGGKLIVTVPESFDQTTENPIIITGSAEHVFSGSIDV